MSADRRPVHDLPRPARRRLLSLAAITVALPAARPAAGQQVLDLDVPFVTTPDNVVLSMLDLAQVSAPDFVLDLGSGDGRIVITAALRYGARGLGVEIDPRLVSVANGNARKAGVDARAKFIVQDLFASDLGQASVITMYLLPDVNIKLRPALLELRPGTRIVSHDWDMGAWTPARTLVVDAPEKRLGLNKQARLMLWVVPANVGGRHVANQFELSIEQAFGAISAARVRWQERSFVLAPGVVRGPSVILRGSSTDGRLLQLAASVVRPPSPDRGIDWRLRIDDQPETVVRTRPG